MCQDGDAIRLNGLDKAEGAAFRGRKGVGFGIHGGPSEVRITFSLYRILSIRDDVTRTSGLNWKSFRLVIFP
jgi:hypothetical protein